MREVSEKAKFLQAGATLGQFVILELKKIFLITFMFKI